MRNAHGETLLQAEHAALLPRQRLLKAVAWSFVPATLVLFLSGPLPLLFPVPVHRMLHLAGALLFLGNVLVGAVWLALADASGSVPTLRFATRVINVADLALTAPGALLALLNGAALANAWGGLFGAPWLVRSLALFGAITCLWAFILVPLQLKLENTVATLPDDAPRLPPPLRRALIAYFVLGGLTAALSAAIGAIMVLK